MRKRDWSFIFLVIALLVVLINPKTANAQCEFMEQLTPYQQNTTHLAYRAGQPYDLGLTTIAISWQESRLGLYKVRYGKGEHDRSFGVMHTVLKWKTKGMSSFEKGVWVQSMVEDDIKSIDTGVKDILYWIQFNKGDWYKGVGSYNGGVTYNKEYADKIVSHVRELKLCNF